MRFTNYRIPKSNLLGKFFEINAKGKVLTKSNPKIMYAGMMNVRKYLLSYSALYLGKALAIAIRYSFMRKQFMNS